LQDYFTASVYQIEAAENPSPEKENSSKQYKDLSLMVYYLAVSRFGSFCLLMLFSQI
jgi:hypothetical protein